MHANSRPMTPPPTTIRRAGTSEMSSASVLVITPGRSRPGIGGRAVIDPGARITLARRHADRVARLGLHLERGRRRQVARAAQQGDTRPPQQVLNPADQRIDGTLLVLHEGRQIGRGRRDGKAEFVRAPRFQQQLGRRGQGLGGNAADVQARASHALSLDQHRRAHRAALLEAQPRNRQGHRPVRRRHSARSSQPA